MLRSLAGAAALMIATDLNPRASAQRVVRGEIELATILGVNRPPTVSATLPDLGGRISFGLGDGKAFFCDGTWWRHHEGTDTRESTTVAGGYQYQLPFLRSAEIVPHVGLMTGYRHTSDADTAGTSFRRVEANMAEVAATVGARWAKTPLSVWGAHVEFELKKPIVVKVTPPEFMLTRSWYMGLRAGLYLRFPRRGARN
jgi:hypothetical protein